MQTMSTLLTMSLVLANRARWQHEKLASDTRCCRNLSNRWLLNLKVRESLIYDAINCASGIINF